MTGMTGMTRMTRMTRVTTRGVSPQVTAGRARQAPAGGGGRRAARPRPGGRRGGVMVLVLVALAVAAAIAATLVRSALLARRGLRTEHHLRQVERLLVAGADATRARLRSGEPIAWQRVLAPADVAGSGSARLTVAPAVAAAPAATLVVEYPLEGPLTIRRSRTVVLPSTPVSNPEEPRP